MGDQKEGVDGPYQRSYKGGLREATWVFPERLNGFSQRDW